MKKTKKKRKKQSSKKIYLLMMIVAALFMGIGYAQVTRITLGFEGGGEASVFTSVVITNVSYLSNSEADTTNSKINFARETMVDSSIILGNVSTSTITYQITVYNNTDKEHVFIGVITDTNDSSLYSNPNIEFSVTELEEYKTTIAPGETIVFELTFKYKEGADVSNGILASKLNFRFKEIPKFVLSNEGKELTTSKMYPGYTETYEFTVSNYDEDGINTVPMTYDIVVTHDAPFIAKIYDEEDNEIVDGISISGDGKNKVEHTYKLKIIWEKSTDSLDYSEYENKEFIGNITLTAVPNESDKYLEYSIEKQVDILTKVSAFYLEVESESTLNMEKDGVALTVAVNNYNSSTEYNNFDLDYEVIVEGNDKFDVSIDGETSDDNTFSRVLAGEKVNSDEFDINFSADINELETSETLTLKIVSKMPYEKEILIPLTINLQAVNITLNANGGNVSPSSMVVYKGRTYTNLPTPTWTGHTFNGWYTTAASDGSKITNTTEVTTNSSTQTLYARWTSYLLADVVSVGDYVDYAVYYNNVATNSDGAYIPKSTYNGWRVLSIEGSGDDKYVRLVTAGIPLTYKHYATSSSGTTSVTALTTNFFSTAIASTATNYKYHNCGFKTSSTATSTVSTISAVQDLFENDYTQTSSSGVPLVQAMTKDDIDEVWGSTLENGEYVTSNDLLAIPASDVSGYAAYHLATATLYSSDGLYYLWNVRYAGGVIFTSSEHGIRPVVKLKSNVIKVIGSGTSSSPYTISVE